jgi:hypothetical protein
MLCYNTYAALSRKALHAENAADKAAPRRITPPARHAKTTDSAAVEPNAGKTFRPFESTQAATRKADLPNRREGWLAEVR